MAQNQATRNWTFTGLLDRIRGLKILLVLLLFIGLGVTCLFLGAQRPSGVARDVLIAIGTTCISTSMVAYCFDLLVRGESQRTLRDTIASAVTDPPDFFEALSPDVRERMIEAILGRGHLETVSPRCSDRVAVEALSRQLGENRQIAEPLLQLVKAH
ncbi:MAG: hypothetical protein IPK67_02090 [Planctomycetes bacterium]|nr:hypothetical protein [Planctomycetota bacterium]